MTENPMAFAPGEPVEVPLKNPPVAAFYAWLWPGAGHLYQGRTAKGILFMVCILSTYLLGFAIGGKHVVYASWQKPDRRWAYLGQVGIGVPALPALLQNQVVRHQKRPALFGGIMAPPATNAAEDEFNELSEWHGQYAGRFEIGTLYTVVAGLLNVLVIYDALAGPAFITDEKKNRKGKDPPTESSAPPTDEKKT